MPSIGSGGSGPNWMPPMSGMNQPSGSASDGWSPGGASMPQGQPMFGGGRRTPQQFLQGYFRMMDEVASLEAELKRAQLMGLSPMQIAGIQQRLDNANRAMQKAKMRAQMNRMMFNQKAQMASSVGVNGRGGAPNPYYMNTAMLWGMFG